MESFEEKQKQNPKDTFEEIIKEEWEKGAWDEISALLEQAYSASGIDGQDQVDRGDFERFALNVLARYSLFLFQKVQARKQYNKECFAEAEKLKLTTLSEINARYFEDDWFLGILEKSGGTPASVSPSSSPAPLLLDQSTAKGVEDT